MTEFENWMFKVDSEVMRISGCSIHDLPDCPFMEWFDACYEPKEAAEEALEYAGF